MRRFVPSSLRSLPIVVSACAALVASTGRAHAQEAVLLQLRPRVGDTLRTRLDQQTEITMTMPGGSSGTSRASTTSAVIDSRTIVRSAAAMSTIVLTVVDSASFASSDSHSAELVAQAERSLEGQQLLLQLAWDGTVESARDARTGRLSRDVVDAMSTMPAVFPKNRVSVGEEWTREMPLPKGGPSGTLSAGHVRATFRLDSLQRGSRLAFVSMRGQIVPESQGELATTGSISGAMQLDRERGWMTDSRFVVVMRSAMRASALAGSGTLQLVTRVTQRLRTMDKR